MFVFALCRVQRYGDCQDRDSKQGHRNAPKLIDPTNMQEGVMGCRDEFVLHVALHMAVGDGPHIDSGAGKPWRAE